MTLLAFAVVFHALVGAGLLACAYLFATAKRDMRTVERRWAKRQAAADEAIRKLEAEAAELRSRLQEADERAGLLAPPAPPRSGLNLSKRSQALRMHRHGEQPEQIAAGLGVTKGEVDLLLKVHRIALDQVLSKPQAN